jgi:hypothetical protein
VLERRFDDAKPLYKEALRIQVETLGPDHSKVGEILYRFGDLHVRLGDWAEAVDLLRRTTAVIAQKNLGPSQRPDAYRRVPGSGRQEFISLLKAADRLSSASAGRGTLATESSRKRNGYKLPRPPDPSRRWRCVGPLANR